MSHRRLLVLFAFLSTAAYAQWLDFPTPGIPRTPDGKPNLAAPAPRTADGKPDLSGVWMHEISTVAEMRRLYGAAAIDEQVKVQVPGMEIGTQHKYFLNILLDFKPGESPLRPEAAEITRRNAVRRDSENPCSTVFGFPLAGLLSEPIKIVQSPRVTVVLYEVGNLHRQIFTDGRALPKEFELPAYLGYSAGHWERDVLVVETGGFNDKTPLDAMGHPHSEALRVTERFHRRDFGHLDVDTTLDDPKMYTKPFTIKVAYDLLADADIFEMYCNENEKDAVHMQKR
ncbi:MAG TPA: hypothetical protein VEV17_09150 [Bryobacteraceae bacterium]|nr:hypothetical protein [Bryobacteraceae bacterium]